MMMKEDSSPVTAALACPVGKELPGEGGSLEQTPCSCCRFKRYMPARIEQFLSTQLTHSANSLAAFCDLK